MSLLPNKEKYDPSLPLTHPSFPPSFPQAVEELHDSEVDGSKITVERSTQGMIEKGEGGRGGGSEGGRGGGRACD